MKFLRQYGHTLAALILALCLAALLLHPASAHAPVLSAIILLPVVLFGFVVAPQSLWPAADFEQHLAVPMLCRAQLFQRPPPSRKN
jgi:hypothetical protein